MKDYAKIANHPDKEDIIAKLSEGASIRSIESWLKGKYPRSKHLWLSIPTIQAFRKEVLKIEGKVLKDIQDAKKIQDQQLEMEYAAQVAQKSNAYIDKINQIADKHLDTASKILQLDAIIGDRLEHWFNLIKSGEDLPPKADYELRKYIDQQIVVLQNWKKLVEGIADKRVDYNVNITVMNEQIQNIQYVLRELIAEELGIEKAVEFMEKLSDRLNAPKETKELPGKVQDIPFVTAE